MLKRALLLAGAGFLPQMASGSCGSAFCVINTGAEAQSVWTEAGTRIELRYEYINQNTLRSGTHKVGPSGEPGEHDELNTHNRNWRLAIDHNFDARWGMSLVVPNVHRDHKHLYNPPEDEQPAEPELETWRIRDLGDVQAIGRYQFLVDPLQRRAAGAQAGLKLPTGSTDENNSEGEVAERTLQPGTGTTDLMLGAYYRGALHATSDWFVSALFQAPLNSHDGFRPGKLFGLNIGANVPLAGKLSAQLQGYCAVRSRDSGREAEPEDSGGRFVYVGPGLSFALDQHWTFYSYAQVPVYQHVNGRQLTADIGAVAGASLMF